MANVFEQLQEAMPTVIRANTNPQGVSIHTAAMIVAACERLAQIPCERRNRRKKFGKRLDRTRFDKTLLPRIFVEGGKERDIHRVFNDLVLREYQIFAIAGFNETHLQQFEFDDIDEVKDLLRTVMRVCRIPGVEEIWNVRLVDQTDFDMSTMDPDFEWCIVEAWYESKEESN